MVLLRIFVLIVLNLIELSAEFIFDRYAAIVEFLMFNNIFGLHC